MFTNAEILAVARQQLALDLHCAPEDLQRRENVVTCSALCPGRRPFTDHPYFFRMATMGGNAVVTADSAVLPALREYVRDKAGPWLFEYPHRRARAAILAPFGNTLDRTYHRYLPLGKPAECRPPARARWYEQAEIAPLYATGLFPNALHERFDPACPDVLAVAAVENGKLMGLAGCYADSPLLWQIGIDVLPAYRGQGLGAGLVTMLRQEILARGHIPYYGTSLANVFSRRIAQQCGFVPAWVEAETLEP